MLGAHLGWTIVAFAHEIERLELAKALKQFHNLLLVEIRRKATDEDLVE